MSSSLYYLRRAMGDKDITIVEGESGYFSAPSTHLDPNLFNGDRLRPEVRALIISIVHGYLSQHWAGVTEWCRIYLTGSGISYQWAAGRGERDLDCQLSVDWTTLREHNPRYSGLTNSELASVLNQKMRTELWPLTARPVIGPGVYELTVYANPAATDIRLIRPYAAYDVDGDMWVVRPPAPRVRTYPQSWSDQVARDVAYARQIVDRFNEARHRADTERPGSPRWVNAMVAAEHAADEAQALWDMIHGGRNAAFSELGGGYGDWANYRWQAHKKSGVVDALRAIVSMRKRAISESERALYRRELPDPDRSKIAALIRRT